MTIFLGSTPFIRTMYHARMDACMYVYVHECVSIYVCLSVGISNMYARIICHLASLHTRLSLTGTIVSLTSINVLLKYLRHFMAFHMPDFDHTHFLGFYDGTSIVSSTPVPHAQGTSQLPWMPGKWKDVWNLGFPDSTSHMSQSNHPAPRWDTFTRCFTDGYANSLPEAQLPLLKHLFLLLGVPRWWPWSCKHLASAMLHFKSFAKTRLRDD